MEFDPQILENEEVRTKVVGHLSEKGFIVKPKEEYEKSQMEWLKGLSHEDERVNHLIAPVVRKEREPLENLVKEFTGIEKQSVDGKPERALDYTKRALETKLAELNEKAKKGVTNEQLVKDFDDYKQSSTQKQKQLTKQIEELNATLLQKDVIFDIDKSIAERKGKFSNDEKIKGLIPAIVESAHRKALESKPEYRQIGDNKQLVFIDENGSVKYKEGNPYTVDKFIEEQLAPIMDLGKQQPGAGTGADGQKPTTSIQIPETIKNTQQLHAFMEKELKLDMAKKENVDLFNQTRKERGLKLF